MVSKQPPQKLGTVPDRTGILAARGDPEPLIQGKSGVYLSQPGAARDNGRLFILGPHCHFQHQKLVNPIQKCKEGVTAVEDSGEGFGEGRSNGAVTGDDEHASDSDSAALRE